MTALYTAEQVHEQGLLPFKPRTLMQFAREDKLGCVRLGVRKIRFTDEHIAAFIAAGDKPQQQPKPARSPRYSK